LQYISKAVLVLVSATLFAKVLLLVLKTVFTSTVNIPAHFNTSAKKPYSKAGENQSNTNNNKNDKFKVP